MAATRRIESLFLAGPAGRLAALLEEPIVTQARAGFTATAWGARAAWRMRVRICSGDDIYASVIQKDGRCGANSVLAGEGHISLNPGRHAALRKAKAELALIKTHEASDL